MATPTPLSLAEIQALATATPKYFPNFAFLIASQTYTTAQVMTIVNTALASAEAVATTKAAAHDALLANQKVQAQYGPFLKELRQFVALAYSNATGTLSDFDIPPKKARTPLSSTARVAAEAKARATREARGTKGKKQKAAVSGNVIGVDITPIVTGAVSSAAMPAPVAAPSSSSAASTPVTTPVVTTGAVTSNGAVQHA